MARLETDDGISLYFEHHRPAATPRQTVIFSCAYCTTHENWRGQIAPLVDAGYAVVLWDLRGHGESDVPESDAGYSMDHVVADLLAVARETTPDAPFVAAGLSFGGLASLHFAHTHPDRVAALALVGSGPGFKKPEAAAGWAAQVERTASFLESRGFDDFVSGKAGATCIGRKPELPAAQRAGEAIRAQTVAGVAKFGRRVSGLAPSVIDELAEMNVPALVLVGDEDKAFLRAAEVMASKLPRAHHVVVPGAGHIVNIEEAETFNSALLGFLDGLNDQTIG
jgi:pimeloyl-ACP methyl ester carboxylesterase